jgi:hypothetical protein
MTLALASTSRKESPWEIAIAANLFNPSKEQKSNREQ